MGVYGGGTAVADMPGLQRVMARDEQIWPPIGFTEYQFVVTFETLVANTTVSLYLGGCGAGNQMDWGDGTAPEEFWSGAASGNATSRNHVYAQPGTYQAVYTGTFTNLGSGIQSVHPYLVSIDHWGDLTGVVDASYGFNGAYQITSIPPLPATVTTIMAMFRGCAAFNGDISGWDTSRFTNMASLFDGAAAFNQDIGGWDVSSVTSMASMFTRAAAFDQDISAWDTRNVTSMETMFRETTFNPDLSCWPVPLIPSLPQGFVYLANPAFTAARQPQWGTMGCHFTGNQLAVTFTTTAANQEVVLRLNAVGDGTTVDWGDATPVETLVAGGSPATGGTPRAHTYATAGTYQAVLTGTFGRMGAYGQVGEPALVSVDWWGEDTGTTNLNSAFAGAVNLVAVAEPPHTVTVMPNLFSGATAFNQDIGGWDTRAVTAMESMFFNASSFDQDLSCWAVPLIPTAAPNFAIGTPAGFTVARRPQWGSMGCFTDELV